MTSTYHIVTVVGARPQFVKAAAMSRAFNNNPRIKETIVHSGQHYDHNLSGGFFSELEIPQPKYNLDIGSMSHNKMIGHFLIAFDDIIDTENPDMILVFGDTNTTSAAAIASAKRNIPLVHVEAGLREWDKSIPEEVNKLLTDSVTDLYFSPTQTGVDNLAQVGITDHVYKTGDISLDLLFSDTKYIEEQELRTRYNLVGDYIFMTCHRDANTSSKEKLSAILEAVSSDSRQVILPLHPRTKAAIELYNIEHLIGANIIITEPLGFWETQSLLRHASLSVTDSGGIIKEAYFHKVPAIIIDKQTEWIETLEEGWNVVTGPDEKQISEKLKYHKGGDIHTNALGDGTCGQQIVDAILDYLDNE